MIEPRPLSDRQRLCPECKYGLIQIVVGETGGLALMCDEIEHMFLDPADIVENRWGRPIGPEQELAPGLWMRDRRLAVAEDLEELDELTRAKWEPWL